MLFTGKWMELEIIMSKPGSEGQRLHVFPCMWKLDLKDKYIHKYIYDQIYIHTHTHTYIHNIHTYMERGREREKP
jgi:hypothetical protein